MQLGGLNEAAKGTFFRRRARKAKSKAAVMYARAVSLAAAHLIGPDANELLDGRWDGEDKRGGGGRGGQR